MLSSRMGLILVEIGGGLVSVQAGGGEVYMRGLTFFPVSLFDILLSEEALFCDDGPCAATRQGDWRRSAASDMISTTHHAS